MEITYAEATVPASQLLLDPNNFRFQDEPDFVRADPARYAEVTVQDRAAKRIRSEGLQELKASIVSNGFLAVERLVVRKYSQREDGEWLYLVLEGNRRAASLKWLYEDYQAGVPVPPSVLATIEAVPVIVTDSEDAEVAYLSLMGIRHVGGIKQWGGYQRAKLVGDLRDKHSLDANDVADRLGMSKHEVNRRYRALKALQQMENDEDFGDYATPSLYPIFHEAVSLPTVREWLSWSDGSAAFQDSDELRRFYLLVTPTQEDEDAQARDPKITTYSQVRDLRSILTHPDAKKVLLDPNRTFGDALGIARADELSGSWRAEIAEATAALNGIGAFELEALEQTDLQALAALGDTVARVLATYSRLHPTA